MLPLVARFSTKAQLLHNGRLKQKNIWKRNKGASSIWFHFASLGEFEQGRPVLERLRELNPDKRIVLTFFSPSGFEIQKNCKWATEVLYMPTDNKVNAQKLIDYINPEIVFFVKYEYWYHYFKTLKQLEIPLFIISAIFRPNQIFFKWYGPLHREMLSCVKHFFVQDQQSATLLQSLEFNNCTISGDTRFDRVYQNALNPKQFPQVQLFTNNASVVVAGSTWPKDELLISQSIETLENFKWIIVPHEVDASHIEQTKKLFPSALLFSKIDSYDKAFLLSSQFLIVDTIGVLSSIYQYATIAYVGGGFDKGIHNTLEPASFGLPIVFGPKNQKFKEAQDLINLGIAKTIQNTSELKTTLQKFTSENELAYIEKKVKDYVKFNINATEKILSTTDKTAPQKDISFL